MQGGMFRKSFLLLNFMIRNRILVLSGYNLPRYTDKEDTEEVAIQAVKTVTGLNVERRSILNVHRQGKDRKLIYVE